MQPYEQTPHFFGNTGYLYHLPGFCSPLMKLKGKTRNHNGLRLEVFMVMKVQDTVLWFVTPYDDMVRCQHFRGPV
jgi:hypothetical protein